MPTSYNILIVDDVIENIELAITILKDEGYNLFFATNGNQAISMVEAEPDKFNFILLDIMMPELDGFDTCIHLKSNTETANIPIIFITAKTDVNSTKKGFSLGAVDYITKPFHPEELLVKVKNHLRLQQANIYLQQHNIDLEKSLKLSQKQYITEIEGSQKELLTILLGFKKTLNFEDADHVERITDMSTKFARLDPNLTAEDEKNIYYSTPLHDIGKVIIPREIRNSKTPLTPEEQKILKNHVNIGYQFLNHSSKKLFQVAAIIAHQHHERWDGKGYPNGLKRDEIHIYARIVSFFDVLDDYICGRGNFRERSSFDEAIEYVTQLSGMKFDPQIVSFFLEKIEDFREFYQ